MAEVWHVRAESIVRQMVQPLERDGGRYVVEPPAADGGKRIVVRSSAGDCDDCGMADDDLAELLQEAIQRMDPEVTVSVVPA